jgi:pyruvate dehydrogenase E1 component
VTAGMSLDGGYARQLPDVDPRLTAEWVDSLDDLIGAHGDASTRQVLAKLVNRAAEREVGFPATVSTPYVNTIPRDDEAGFPGDDDIEDRIESLVLWNTAVMVSRANSLSDGIGGHMATPASCASLSEVGFNHFFQGKDDERAGDQVFFQGHAVPGIYARAYLEGRLSESQLNRFRREIGGGGLSS